MQRANDIWELNSRDSRWTHWNCAGPPPVARSGHTATVWEGHMTIFGGLDGAQPCADLFLLDIVTRVWTAPAVTGDPLPRRNGHCAGQFGKNLLIFGGCDLERRFNDTFMITLSLTTAHCQQLACHGTLPVARTRAASAQHEDKLWIFGGQNLELTKFADLFELSVPQRIWREVLLENGPPPSYGCSMCFWGGSLLLFGGLTAGRRVLADFHSRTRTELAWRMLPLYGVAVPGRFAHAMCVVGTNVVVYGGTGEGATLFSDCWVLV
eukprot:TRINITY_DN17544_c0_g1_i2.p1 TRINITY_DN17544_c0_g1~~TRINITY_DN17544_c0_g1_i2.p1  ORF type:complete len:266 (+),score=19.41 TRINITY_DN17544_c0_g1_i2:339-1136(+)